VLKSVIDEIAGALAGKVVVVLAVLAEDQPQEVSS
jgi:hypothetical protein